MRNCRQNSSLPYPTVRSTHMTLRWYSRKLFNDSDHLDTSYTVKGIRNGICEAPHDSSCLEINFRFTRRLALAFITIYFPSGLIVSVSFVSFWIDSQQVPGRISLIVTSLLALMTQLVSVRNSLPDVNYITALDIWFFACIIFVAFCLFEFAVCYNINKRGEQRISPLIYNRLYTYRRGQKMPQSPTEKFMEFLQNPSKHVKDLMKSASKIDLDHYSRIAFPLTFITYSFIYWTVFLIKRN